MTPKSVCYKPVQPFTTTVLCSVTCIPPPNRPLYLPLSVSWLPYFVFQLQRYSTFRHTGLKMIENMANGSNSLPVSLADHIMTVSAISMKWNFVSSLGCKPKCILCSVIFPFLALLLCVSAIILPTGFKIVVNSGGPYHFPNGFHPGNSYLFFVMALVISGICEILKASVCIVLSL